MLLDSLELVYVTGQSASDTDRSRAASPLTLGFDRISSNGSTGSTRLLAKPTPTNRQKRRRRRSSLYVMPLFDLKTQVVKVYPG